MVVQYVVFGSIDAQTSLSSILTLDTQMADALTNNDVVATSSSCITHCVVPQRSWEGGRPGETLVLHFDLSSKDGILVGSGKDSLKCYSNIGFREGFVSGFRESVGHGFRESAVASGLASHLPTLISTSLASLSSSPLSILYSATVFNNFC